MQLARMIGGQRVTRKKTQKFTFQLVIYIAPKLTTFYFQQLSILISFFYFVYFCSFTFYKRFRFWTQKCLSRLWNCPWPREPERDNVLNPKIVCFLCRYSRSLRSSCALTEWPSCHRFIDAWISLLWKSLSHGFARISCNLLRIFRWLSIRIGACFLFRWLEIAKKERFQWKRMANFWWRMELQFE